MTVQVVCDSVEHWAATYDGPPFMAILTDPPYSLGDGKRGFMNRAWDNDVSFNPSTWAALAAHLLPGAHVLAFGGGRTHHRLMVAIEDAGLEIRDCIYWAFGSGFPKSLNVGKAIDKAAGAEREVVGVGRVGVSSNGRHDKSNFMETATEESKWKPITAPATPAAATWEGYGTALKPAVEVIVVARKPVEGTIAANCERYGSGAINIDASRIKMPDRQEYEAKLRTFKGAAGKVGPNSWKNSSPLNDPEISIQNSAAGRWPANLILDDSEAVAGLFPVTHNGGQNETSGERNGMFGVRHSQVGMTDYAGDSGSAARFFFAADWSLDQAEQLGAADVLRYCAKSSRAEREAGLDGPYAIRQTMSGGEFQPDGRNATSKSQKARNHHPCVKPLALCEYLARLLLPPAAYAPRRILIPFGGVASEAIGAMLAGWDEVVMVEKEREYCDIAEARAEYWAVKMGRQMAMPLEALA